jgi:hypothetical protein
MQGVRALADEFGIVLILDEVMAGFGRTGSWFAFEQDGVVPDLVTFAKGVNAGYVPAGGVLISEPIARYFDDHFFAGGLTYSGHPLAMAAIVATIDAMKEENIVENAAQMGNQVLRPGLEALAEKHAIIGHVRGRGLFQALELVSDREAKTPLTAADMAAIKGALTEAGLLAFVVENRIHVVPPCTISAEQIAKGLAIFDSVFARFASWRNKPTGSRIAAPAPYPGYLPNDPVAPVSAAPPGFSGWRRQRLKRATRPHDPVAPVSAAPPGIFRDAAPAPYPGYPTARPVAPVSAAPPGIFRMAGYPPSGVRPVSAPRDRRSAE